MTTKDIDIDCCVERPKIMICYLCGNIITIKGTTKKHTYCGGKNGCHHKLTINKMLELEPDPI